jgi:hemerythrin-like domain-containing protein
MATATVLRDHLTNAKDLHQLDLMVEEHRGLTTAIQAVDAALASCVGVTTAAQELSDVLGDHLDHEEQQVFPLLERHLSPQGEWRRFPAHRATTALASGAARVPHLDPRQCQR